MHIFRNYLLHKPKVCVLMWYDSNISEYADINYKINKFYCDKYEIDLIRSNKPHYNDRHPTWECLPLSLKYIKNYDYVIWIDADAFFYIDSPNIIDFIQKTPKANFIFSKDVTNRDKTDLNAGFFIIKNTKYSINFLKKWAYDKNLYEKKWTLQLPYWGQEHKDEQGVLQYLYKNNIWNIQKNSIVYDYAVLQHFYSKHIGKNRPNPNALNPIRPFILHFAGHSREKRIRCSKNYYKHNFIK